MKESTGSGTKNKKSAKCFNHISIHIKHEPENEAQHSLHSFPVGELERTVKVEDCSSDNDNGIGNGTLANMVKSELVEFQNNDNCNTFNQNDMKTAMFKKIPKPEVILIDSNVDPSYTSNEKDFFYKNTHTDSGDDTDADPERDPFEDVDCDPSFSQRLQRQDSNHFATRLDDVLINSTNANNESENPTSTSTKSLLPVAPAIRKHNRQRQKLPSKLQCGLCLEMQSSDSMLKTHVEICAASHKNRHRFCVPCNKLFSIHHTYRGHALRRHGIEKAKIYRYSFKCLFCPRSFAHQESFSAHVSSCHESSNTTATAIILDRNLKPKPFQCFECNSRFESHSNLRKHILMSHTNNRPFECPEPNCEKAFTFNAHLMSHLQRIHSDERPFLCQEPNCEKAFKSKDDLKNHKICHAVDRPFKCPHVECNRFFKSKLCVRSHLTFHTGVRRYGPRPM